MSDASAASSSGLYLSRLRVDYDQAIRILGIKESYDWHQLLWQAFPDRDGAERDFLIRVDKKEDAYQALILSQSPSSRPDWCPSACFESKAVPELFFHHPCFAFSLLANPTRKVRSNASGERTKNGRRLPLVLDAELVPWLERKATAGGFSLELPKLQILRREIEYFHKNGRQGTHVGIEFRGRLQVTDPVLFKAAVTAGIGSAKAFGFGLLVLAPLN